jgi:hypothetical protein
MLVELRMGGGQKETTEFVCLEMSYGGFWARIFHFFKSLSMNKGRTWPLSRAGNSRLRDDPIQMPINEDAAFPSQKAVEAVSKLLTPRTVTAFNRREMKEATCGFGE